jgi:hypothetical protein
MIVFRTAKLTLKKASFFLFRVHSFLQYQNKSTCDRPEPGAEVLQFSK